MFQKRGSAVPAIIFAVAMICVFTGCEKLKVSRLKANYHFTQANGYFTEGMYRKAITEYELTLKNNPNLVEAYRFLGESYKSLFKPGVESADNKEKAEKALEALAKAHEIAPDNKEVIYSLGDMYDKLRNFDQAEKLYLKILDLEPGNMGNYYVVAEFYKRYVGDKPELRAKAESMYLRRIEADPENPQGYAYLASYFEHITPVPEFDKANEMLEKRITLEPESAEAWLAKGVNRWSKSYRLVNFPANERLGYARDSMKALEKARDLDPNYPEPYIYLSVLYQSVLAKLDPERESRYKAEGDRANEKFLELRKREIGRAHV